MYNNIDVINDNNNILMTLNDCILPKRFRIHI